MKKRWLKFSGILAVVCVAVTGLCGCTNEKIATRTDFALDTVVTISVYGQSDEEILREPFNKIRELNNKLSPFIEDSEISQVNASAGIAPVVVSEETFEIVKKGLEYSAQTDGAFDITIGPLVDLWQIEAPREGSIPEQSAIDAAKALVDYHKVVLDERARSVFLEEPGMKLNLGAIAKGYIGDQVKVILESEGIDRAIINLGGNVVLIGGKSNREPFTVSVENPENPTSGGGDSSATTIGVLREKDHTIVTSGDYERYIIGPDGRRYHHILDPRTGYPAESGLHQVTVVTDRSTDADALTTSFFIMGLDKAQEYLREIEGIEAIFVTADNRVVVTGGLREVFTFDSQHYGGLYALEFITP